MKARNDAMLLVGCLALWCLPVGASAEPPEADSARELAVELGAPFRDHAILQRGMKVPVWGWSKPGTEVTVQFAGQSKTTRAGKDPSTSSGQAARWTVWLDPLKARAASQFSALSLPFAHELHKELKVPIGILLTSHSNTRIEAFTEHKAIEAHAVLGEDADLVHDGDVTTGQGRAAFEQFYLDLAAWQDESARQGFPVERPLRRPSLPGTYRQVTVPFFYAQPVATLVEGITAPSLPAAKHVTIDDWPKSLKDVAAQLGRLAR